MMAENREWCELHGELVGEIMQRIDSPGDVVALMCVCRSWYSAVAPVKKNWPPGSPWFMCSENAKDSPDCMWKLYNPLNDTCLHLNLPNTLGRKCVGAGHGWLVTVGLDLEIHMMNPVTKSCLTLPPLSTMMTRDDDYYARHDNCTESAQEYWLRDFYITNAFVLQTSRCEGDEGGLIVVCIHMNEVTDGDSPLLVSTSVSVAKPGDERWILKDTANAIKMVSAVAFWRESLWIADNDGCLWQMDVNTGEASKFVDVLPEPPLCEANDYECDWCRYYLAVSGTCGDLLLIERAGLFTRHDNLDQPESITYDAIMDYYRRNNFYYTKSMEVYKLDLSGRRWVWVSNVGDATLFVGLNTYMCVTNTTSKTMFNCHSNCIYFTEQFPVNGTHDMGMYNLDTKAITSLCSSRTHTGNPLCNGCDTRCNLRRLFWFMPQL